MRVVAVEGGGKVVGRVGHAVCFHFAAYLDGNRGHVRPVAVHRGKGDDGRGCQSCGGKGHGDAFCFFGKQIRIILRAGGSRKEQGEDAV